MVCLLAENGADIHLVDGQGYNSLHIAIHGKQPNVLLLLLALGGDINSLDSFGRTPLMWAAYSGEEDDLIKILLNWGADTNYRDVTGYTALHWAVVSSHFYFGKLLLSGGIDQEIKDETGKTARDLATERSWSLLYDEMAISVKPGYLKKVKRLS